MLHDGVAVGINITQKAGEFNSSDGVACAPELERVNRRRDLSFRMPDKLGFFIMAFVAEAMVGAKIDS